MCSHVGKIGRLGLPCSSPLMLSSLLMLRPYGSLVAWFDSYRRCHLCHSQPPPSAIPSRRHLLYHTFTKEEQDRDFDRGCSSLDCFFPEERQSDKTVAKRNSQQSLGHLNNIGECHASPEEAPLEFSTPNTVYIQLAVFSVSRAPSILKSCCTSRLESLDMREVC